MSRRCSLYAAVLLVACTFASGQLMPVAATSPTTSTLPAATSNTAYDPHFNVGRGYWKRDYLVYVHSASPSVDLYDRNSLRLTVTAQIPGAEETSLTDAAVAKTGELIVSGSAKLKSGEYRRFVALADHNGQVSRLVDTGGYAPTRVTTCDGITAWTLGWERTPAGTELEESYAVLRQYRLSDGALLASALDRTSFPKWPVPALTGLHQHLT